MTYQFNQVEFVRLLEKEGLGRGAAEAIAQGIDDGRRELVTKADLELALAHAGSKQTVQFGVMLGAGLALAVAIIGLIVGLN